MGLFSHEELYAPLTFNLLRNSFPGQRFRLGRVWSWTRLWTRQILVISYLLGICVSQPSITGLGRVIGSNTPGSGRVGSHPVVGQIYPSTVKGNVKDKGKGLVLAIALLTRVRLMTRSALQSWKRMIPRKWQLIGMIPWRIMQPSITPLTNNPRCSTRTYHRLNQLH